MAKPICKECGTNLMGHNLSGAVQRRCSSCHASFKKSMGKNICNNCGVDVIGSNTCSRCQRTNNAPRVLTSQNINTMLWYEGKKAWE